MNKRIRIVALVWAIGMFAALAAACSTQPNNNASSNPPEKTAGAQPPSDKGDRVVTGGDLAFMNDAAPGGMAEVELGRLAAKQAASQDVKRFGQHMVDDHSKVNRELMQLAQQKKVMLPQEVTPEQKQSMEKLSKLKGADFDREYVKEMVKDHEKDVAAFNAVAMNGTDADVKAFAAKTLPTLQEHLQAIRDIEKTMGGKAKP